MKALKKLCLAFMIIFAFMLTACNGNKTNHNSEENTDEVAVAKTGDIIILYTSDVHCGIDKGFGYAGLKAVRDSFEAKGYETILVDNGDAIQGELIGSASEGEDIIELMNDLQYDIAVPGNHEFDYGVEEFMELTEKADFPYISCNFTKNGEVVFNPYIIKEAGGKKIAFVGITTPKTISESTPSLFKDKNGNYIYDFMIDETGELLYNAVQKAVDDARAAGADYVYALGHLGSAASASPWTAAEVIANTTGIDVLIDGHSHDSEQMLLKNKNGEDVVRTACGTKMQAIGYSHIDPDGKIAETNIYSWDNEISAPELLNLDNDISKKVKDKLDVLNELMSEVVGSSDFDLTILNPDKTDESGKALRAVRNSETNLGDFTADAFKYCSGADIAIMNGGGIRENISAGDITMMDLFNTQPFGDKLCVVEATGQQILDALEWSYRALPAEEGGFLQIAGLTLEVDTTVASSCTADADGNFVAVSGDRRVQNVKVNGEDIDPNKTYSLASSAYLLKESGNGLTVFAGANDITEVIMSDYKTMEKYIKEGLNGKLSSDYADPHGQGRIVIK
ncbi:MAG: bifunctional metallophosphatase/5'-nucleotidase [Parasporobacterium sp.]|nr:bifunctional metallophosphatase/5'-nucleotidase [Parasporobacterium sp.]